MKSITTCPSCQTQFLVTDEQLSQYNGKVRCGHCLNVFNAVDYILVSNDNQQDNIVTEHIETRETSESSESIVQPQEAKVEVNIEEEILSNSSETVVPEVEKFDPLQELADPDPILMDEIVSSTTKPDELNAIPETVKSAEVLKEIFAQAELPLEEVRESLPIHPEEDLTSYKVNDETQEEVDSINFQNEISKINEFDYKPEYQYYLEQKKSTSPKLLLLGGVLVLLALIQCVFFYRHSIAMQFPDTKPYLVKICQTLGCRINLPKEIQLFSIDDSTLQEDSNYQGVIRLSSTITNRADFNQAYPNLEVTLTDTQDQPKLRRIFKPNEYLSKEFNLEEGIAPGDSIDINMPLMADDLKPAGFRIMVSY